MRPSEFTDCWRTGDPNELSEFLYQFSKLYRPISVSEVQLQTCICSGMEFYIDLAESISQLKCIACGKKTLIHPSDAALKQSSERIDDYEKCDECGLCTFNAAIGFASFIKEANQESLAWAYLGVRCCSCGLLSCIDGTCSPPLPTMPFDPSSLCALAAETKPDMPWLPETLMECTSGIWINAITVQFVESSNANEPGSEWQHLMSVKLFDPSDGIIILDILESGKIGGIEFRGRRSKRQLNAQRIQ